MHLLIEYNYYPATVAITSLHVVFSLDEECFVFAMSNDSL